jgi:hypothetical protein
MPAAHTARSTRIANDNLWGGDVAGEGMAGGPCSDGASPYPELRPPTCAGAQPLRHPYKLVLMSGMAVCRIVAWFFLARRPSVSTLAVWPQSPSVASVTSVRCFPLAPVTRAQAAASPLAVWPQSPSVASVTSVRCFPLAPVTRPQAVASPLAAWSSTSNSPP